jgi:hypothetical protein
MQLVTAFNNDKKAVEYLLANNFRPCKEMQDQAFKDGVLLSPGFEKAKQHKESKKLPFPNAQQMAGLQ